MAKKQKETQQDEIMTIDMEGRDPSKIVFVNLQHTRKTGVRHSGDSAKGIEATGVKLHTVVRWDYSGNTLEDILQDADRTNNIAFGNFSRKQEVVDFVAVMGYEGEIQEDLTAAENEKNLVQAIPVLDIHRNNSSNPLAAPETPEQYAAGIKAQAAKLGMTVPQFIETYLS